MTRSTMWRALLALAVLAVAGYLVVDRPTRLGLDLRGGTSITLEAQDTATREATAEATDRAVEVLRRRVDALGVAEPTLARSGEDRIIVELPGLDDPDQAAEVIGRTAQLTFHSVTAAVGPVPDTAPAAEKPMDQETAVKAQLDGKELRVPDESGAVLTLAPAALTGEEVSDARGVSDQFGTGWTVDIDFRGGGDKYAKITADAACKPAGDPQRRVAIVLDGEVISSPQVDPSVQCGTGIAGGRTTITGDFTQAESQDLALLIRGGALPVPVEIIEQRVVGPSLGEEAINASAIAAVIGTIATALFMIIVYRLSGLLAVIGIGAYFLLALGALKGLGATLTLPGLAGALLALGSVVDTNVLVNERAREEWHGQQRKSMTGAVRAGFSKALTAIADSNITTLLAAALLFFLASGPVRGFGVTLTLGVLAGLFASLIVVRVLTELLVAKGPGKARPALSGLSDLGRLRTRLTAKNPQLMARRKLWLTISAVSVLLALAGIGIRGLNLGVEFTGGRVIEYSASETLDVEEVRSAVEEAGYPRAVVQSSGEGAVTVRTPPLENEEARELQAAIGEATGTTLDVERDELVGPTLGDELRRKALIALAVALLAQMAYMAFRFKPTFAGAAVLAMFHDVLLVTGLFAWLQRPVDGVFLAAVLAIVGLSINDSVVVFDRIRDVWRHHRKRPLPDIANEAVLATVPRTINTGLGTMFILVALLFLGGESLTDFALAMFFGLVVGTASSMFIATPLMLALEKRWPSQPPAAPLPPGRQRKVGVSSNRGGAVV